MNSLFLGDFSNELKDNLKSPCKRFDFIRSSSFDLSILGLIHAKEAKFFQDFKWKVICMSCGYLRQLSICYH